MSTATNYITQETFDKLREELSILKSTGRAEISNAISEAREKGDLKENAEYDAAKEAQGMHEAKIARIENALATSKIIDKDEIDTSKVSILSTVTIKNLKTKKSLNYTIVSETEANLKEGKISVQSPIAKGLVGKRVGDVADILTPGGNIKFEIEAITI